MNQDECHHIRRTLSLTTRYYDSGMDTGWGQYIIASCIQCGHIMENDEIVEVLSREAKLKSLEKDSLILYSTCHGLVEKEVSEIEMEHYERITKQFNERVHELKKEMIKRDMKNARVKIEKVLEEKKSWIGKVLSNVLSRFRS